MAHPRTVSRELALQYLYMYDSLHGREVQPLSEYLSSQLLGEENLSFVRTLADCVIKNYKMLDDQISGVASNWKISRMSIVDRNIIRLGLAEFIFCPETPRRVVLNEAVEMARRFSSDSSCAFVNGVLDKLCAGVAQFR